MHVSKQEKLALPTEEQMKAVANEYEHECKFCNQKYKTLRGLKIHMASCNFQYRLADEEDTIENINAVFGTPAHRWYRVAWEGHPGKDTWEPENSLTSQGCEGAIKDFWLHSKHEPSEDFIADPNDVWRCWCCGKGYSTERILDAHITRQHSTQHRKWRGTSADRDARIKLQKEFQATKAKVMCEGVPLENVWRFLYLGSIFRADGSHLADVRSKIAIARSTAGKMRNIWSSRHIPLSLKMRIYKTGVCSKLCYGSESWLMDEQTTRMLNGANSQMVARITGNSAHHEADPKTRTFDLTKWIRARRLQWVGHLLRLNDQRDATGTLRMVHLAVKHMFENRTTGDLLQDVPQNVSWDELLALAAHKARWRQMVHGMKKSPV